MIFNLSWLLLRIQMPLQSHRRIRFFVVLQVSCIMYHRRSLHLPVCVWLLRHPAPWICRPTGTLFGTIGSTASLHRWLAICIYGLPVKLKSWSWDKLLQLCHISTLISIQMRFVFRNIHVSRIRYNLFSVCPFLFTLRVDLGYRMVIGKDKSSLTRVSCDEHKSKRFSSFIGKST